MGNRAEGADQRIQPRQNRQVGRRIEGREIARERFACSGGLAAGNWMMQRVSIDARYRSFSPVNRSNASRYFADVFSITSCGNMAPAASCPNRASRDNRAQIVCRSSADFGQRVLIGRPEAGGIGRQTFVDQKQFAIHRSEFEFRVRDNDAALRGVIAARRVNLAGSDPAHGSRSHCQGFGDIPSCRCSHRGPARSLSRE